MTDAKDTPQPEPENAAAEPVSTKAVRGRPFVKGGKPGPGRPKRQDGAAAAEPVGTALMRVEGEGEAPTYPLGTGNLEVVGESDHWQPPARPAADRVLAWEADLRRLYRRTLRVVQAGERIIDAANPTGGAGVSVIDTELIKARSAAVQAAVSAMRAAAGQIEMMGRNVGALRTAEVNVQINLVESPEWKALLSLLLMALMPFPEARAAVVRVLEARRS